MRRRRTLLWLLLAGAIAADCTTRMPFDIAGLVTVPPECEPAEFINDTVLDIDIRAARIHGVLSIDHHELPAGSPHGALVFRDRVTHAIGRFGLGTTRGQFAATLPPGRYDVAYEPPPDPCAAATVTALPCASTTVATDVDLTRLADVERNFEIRTVRVTGAVRLAGVTTTTAGGSFIRFDSTHTASLRAGFVSIAPNGTYDVRLGVDTYNLGWIPSQVRCDPIDATFPCSSGSLGRSIEVNDAGAIDIAVPTVRLELRLSVNGVVVQPRNNTYRVSLDDANSEVLAFGPTTTPTLVRRVLPGTYQVRITESSSCISPSTNPWPCGTTVLPEPMRLTADLTTTIDVRSVHVRGQLLIDGRMFPQLSTPDRGALLFRSAARREETVTAIDDSTIARAFYTTTGGPAAFDLWLQRGHYDVFYVSSSSCDISGNVPCGVSLVAKDVVFDGDTTRDFDLRPVALLVTLTNNGLALPEAANRGTLRLDSLDAPYSNLFPLTTTGPTRVATMVARGRYRGFFVGAPTGCEPIACGTTLLDDEIRVEGATSVTTELPRAFVRGRVTVNHQPFDLPAGSTASLVVVGMDSGLVQALPIQNGAFATPAIGAGRYYTVFAASECEASTPENLLCASEIVECP